MILADVDDHTLVGYVQYNSEVTVVRAIASGRSDNILCD